jgi:hypothetical protein
VSSHRDSDGRNLDLDRDATTTPDDIETLRRVRRESASWFSLTPAEVEALLPDDALERRPPMPDDAEPFTLP